ncbi:MAG: LysR family transcriptional regulator [Eubacteriales bacterium]|nr:LysR family transcriptional regulator [Eubacteriales bacterium]
MDLKQLQYLVASIDSGSFKKAAEVLYTSQPHISKTVKSLETELQVELLRRKARGVEATEAGRKVYEYACRILVESGKIQNVRSVQGARSLRVASMPDDRLRTLFGEFYAQQSKSGLLAEYMEQSAEEILRAVHHHRADMGFLQIERTQRTALQQMLEHKRLVFEELKSLTPLLLVGPENPLYQAQTVTGKELRELSYVQTDADQDALTIPLIQRNEDYQYHRRRGQVLMTNSRELLLRMVQETELCSVSVSLPGPAEGRDQIRGIPIRGGENSVVFGYVRRRRENLTEEARLLADFVCRGIQ